VNLRRPLTISAVAVLLSCLLYACTEDSGSTSSAAGCVVAPAASILPPEGVLFGVNLDWGNETLQQYATDLGHAPAVTVAFVGVPFVEEDQRNVMSAVAQIRAVGGSLLLTLEPSGGLSTVTDSVALDIAQFSAEINEAGVPVIIRFAHEMNGSWYAWGQQPIEYIAAFRRVATAVHNAAPGSSMMWAPNGADGYPFTGGASTAQAGSDDFAELDTDGDGTITLADDPYAPYYPGDDAVDWVGMSLYHWGSMYPWGENELPEPGKFAAQLTGTYVGTQGDSSMAPDFYQVYGVDHAKPVAIPETAAMVVPRGDPEGELAIKQQWWRQVFSSDFTTRFPQVKMINWFEWTKDEPEVGAVVEWSAIGSAASRATFTADLPPWLVYASGRTTCAAPAK
jgi:hypothetical protein